MTLAVRARMIDVATRLPTSTDAACMQVNISQMRFQPATLEVKADETVTWRNGGGRPQTGPHHTL